MSRTFFVSNRLPVSVRNDRARVAVVRSSGGLATALSGPHDALDAWWVGWPGDVSRASPENIHALDQCLEAMRCLPVHLTPSEVTQYYDGFANGVLWPLLHYFLDKVHLDAQSDWTAYEEVNQRFAERVAALLRPDDIVWVHDYQLALVPELLRRRVADVRIGFFLHVPFPPPEVFSILPWRRRLLEGIAGADLVGFQTQAYADAFRKTAEALLGAERAPQGFFLGERRVRVAPHPIGIDVEAFERIAASTEVEAERERIIAGANGKKIVLGVDRLDYTKGIPRRLLALEHLLEQAPELREQILFIQLAVPTREKVEAYASLRRQVHELVGRINARYGTPTFSPVQLLYRSVGLTELVALYQAADVMLVTPLRDGMNLVAKEYLVSRVDELGVLVLSEFAGAVTELSSALVVNPYDVSGVASALRTALEMSAAEQRARMRPLRWRARQSDARAWAALFLKDLRSTAEPASGTFETADVAKLGSPPR